MDMLNERQELFCQQYVIDGNGTQAAIRAGYKPRGAAVHAARMLINVNILKRIAELKADFATRLNITKERIAKEYAKVAFFDIRDIFTVDDALTRIKELDDNSAGAIAGVEIFEEKVKLEGGETFSPGLIKKVKINDKVRALDSLVAMLGYAAPTKIANTDSKGEDKKEDVIDYSKLSAAALKEIINAKK